MNNEPKLTSLSIWLYLFLSSSSFNSHLDAVRAIAFHPTELCLATGGDDCTVKIWRMDVAGLASSACVFFQLLLFLFLLLDADGFPRCFLMAGHALRSCSTTVSPFAIRAISFVLERAPPIFRHTPPNSRTYTSATNSTRAITEVEPQLTLRGHSAAITRLIISPSKQLLYSASLDSTVRVWSLPPPSHTTYAPFDASRMRGELIGHTDAVWDLALVRDESRLISCGAEGSVKVWDVERAGREGARLRGSWMYGGVKDEGAGGVGEEGEKAGGEGEEDEVEKEEGEEGEGEGEGEMPGATAVEAIKVDLKKVAVAYTNGVIKIFDIEDGKELLKLTGETSGGNGMSFSISA